MEEDDEDPNEKMELERLTAEDGGLLLGNEYGSIVLWKSPKGLSLSTGKYGSTATWFSDLPRELAIEWAQAILQLVQSEAGGKSWKI